MRSRTAEIRIIAKSTSKLYWPRRDCSKRVIENVSLVITRDLCREVSFLKVDMLAFLYRLEDHRHLASTANISRSPTEVITLPSITPGGVTKKPPTIRQMLTTRVT